MTTSDEGVSPEEPLVVQPVADTPPLGSAEPVAAVPVMPAPGATGPAPYAAAPAPPQAYGAPSDTPNTWMNIVAFVTGLLGLAIIPVVFGHMGISASNKGKAEYKWMGIVGAVLGYLEIVGYIIAVVAIGALFAGAAVSTN